MERQPIPCESLSLPPFGAWKDDWLLLAAGDHRTGAWHCQTVDWGCLGVLWGRPVAIILVRPSRIMYRFLETTETFTLSAFDPAHREALERFGPHLGREGSRADAEALGVGGSRLVAAPSFSEAVMVMECRKACADDLAERHCTVEWIREKYPRQDFHRVFVGEILAIEGVARYRRSSGPT